VTFIGNNVGVNAEIGRDTSRRRAVDCNARNLDSHTPVSIQCLEFAELFLH